jgi:hypothetical protein
MEADTQMERRVKSDILRELHNQGGEPPEWVRRATNKILNVLGEQTPGDACALLFSVLLAAQTLVFKNGDRQAAALELADLFTEFAAELAAREKRQVKPMKNKPQLFPVERTPESEKDVTVFHKSDADIRVLMGALGVCQRCADHAIAMLRAPAVEPATPIRTPEGFYCGEPIGFEVCSKICADGIMAALTMQQH